ncbi:MAG: hypothetical protein ACR2MZ_10520 [Candidatus Dormibacter sp.]|uniref:hypothetical protein n=1 Tax=Candidatus Dormibacter sp. TaxID=2973982 RepID=UPI000DB399EA|nr:MAG: hypothetical protein DLM66_00465 [Candidatus Dormibacteraeota bacterium]
MKQVLNSIPPQFRPALNLIANGLRTRESDIRANVARVTAENPGKSPEELARILIGQTRRRVSATGAVSGATAILPGLGTIVALGTVTGQGLWALEQEAELVMAIAMLFGHELADSDDRLVEALVIVGVAGGAVKLRDNVLVAGGRGLSVAAFRRFPASFATRTGGHVLGRIIARVAGTRAVASVARVAPLAIGLVVGAGFDWVTVTALGRAAIRYYGPNGPAAQAALEPPYVQTPPRINR